MTSVDQKPDIKNPQWLIEAIDRELSHYRKRVGQIFFFGFFLEVLVLGGKEKILLGGVSETEKAIIYTLLFLTIPSIALLFGREYLSRIHMLKESRNSFLELFGLNDVFPISRHHRVNEIHTMTGVLVSLSLAGIIIFWVNALNPLDRNCENETSYNKSIKPIANAPAELRH